MPTPRWTTEAEDTEFFDPRFEVFYANNAGKKQNCQHIYRRIAQEFNDSPVCRSAEEATKAHEDKLREKAAQKGLSLYPEDDVEDPANKDLTAEEFAQKIKDKRKRRALDILTKASAYTVMRETRR